MQYFQQVRCPTSAVKSLKLLIAIANKYIRLAHVSLVYSLARTHISSWLWSVTSDSRRTFKCINITEFLLRQSILRICAFSWAAKPLQTNFTDDARKDFSHIYEKTNFKFLLRQRQAYWSPYTKLGLDWPDCLLVDQTLLPVSLHLPLHYNLLLLIGEIF